MFFTLFFFFGSAVCLEPYNTPQPVAAQLFFLFLFVSIF
jgi:hypothetical protein